MFTNEESGACLPGACAADCGRCENSCHQVRSQTCIGVKVTTISGNGGMPEERFMGGEAESPDVLGAEGLVGAVLGLEDDGGLDDLEAVPGARGDVHPVAALVAAERRRRTSRLSSRAAAAGSRRCRGAGARGPSSRAPARSASSANRPRESCAGRGSSSAAETPGPRRPGSQEGCRQSA